MMELAAEQSQWRQGLDGCGTKNTGGPREGVRNVGKGDLGSSLRRTKAVYLISLIHIVSFIYSVPPQMR